MLTVAIDSKCLLPESRTPLQGCYVSLVTAEAEKEVRYSWDLTHRMTTLTRAICIFWRQTELWQSINMHQEWGKKGNTQKDVTKLAQILICSIISQEWEEEKLFLLEFYLFLLSALQFKQERAANAAFGVMAFAWNINILRDNIYKN